MMQSVNLGVQISYRWLFCLLWNYCWICGSSVFSFYRNPETGFHMAVPVYQQSIRVPFFPHKLLPKFVISCLFDSSRVYRCEIISHSGFGLHFPHDQWCWVPLHIPLTIFILSLKKCLCRSFAPFLIRLFVFLVLTC